MLENLTQRLSRVVKTIRGEARLTEANTQDMLREVRLALLEADVSLPVVRDFVAKVKESFPEMKCFLMSGYDFDEQIANAINTGLILSYFMKPFDLNKIRSTLRMYLNE